MSDIIYVISGVPQGSVLGHILFLLYINDINEHVQSSIRLFADDIIIYSQINSNIDHEIIQTDLTKLEKWSDKWQNVYPLFGHPLSKVASHSYFGLKLYSKLSWAKHVTEISTKSSKVLARVKRTLCLCKPEVKDTAYNMLVRPKLEYASPIWNPHTSSQLNQLEIIQHYAARFVANDHRRTTIPITIMLTINWQTLERQRIINQAMTFQHQHT